MPVLPNQENTPSIWIMSNFIPLPIIIAITAIIPRQKQKRLFVVVGPPLNLKYMRINGMG
jgi:hypothetical protein